MSPSHPQPALITRVLPGSIALEMGFEPGDRLVSINGTAPRDLIDYQFLCAEESLTIEVQDKDGCLHSLEVEKETDEDLGLEFATALFDGLIQCNNHCPFCFIDQQPDYLRDTLHLKDDDYRLSFLYGSYLTLTNLGAAEWERIARLRLAPLFVSVHATEPGLRARMLKNQRAGLILDQLAWFRERRLSLHAQVVLCPGLNDGEHLEQTLRDLADFHAPNRPTVLSTAVVPVGLTRFRLEADELQSVTPELARQVIRQVSTLQKQFLKQLGTRFVWLSDEWYLLAGQALPGVRHYEGYPQIGNGVGSLRQFLEQFARASHALPVAVTPRRYTWVVGSAVGQAFIPIADRLNRIAGLQVRLRALPSHFWGQNITVTGLLTGKDILAGLEGEELGDALVLPGLMLKENGEFLDSLTIEQLAEHLATPVLVVGNGAQSLIETFIRPRAVGCGPDVTEESAQRSGS